MLLATALFAVGYQRAIRKDPGALVAISDISVLSTETVAGSEMENVAGTVLQAEMPSDILDVTGTHQGG